MTDTGEQFRSHLAAPMFQSSISVSRVPSDDKDKITCLPGVAETSPLPTYKSVISNLTVICNFADMSQLSV